MSVPKAELELVTPQALKLWAELRGWRPGARARLDAVVFETGSESVLLPGTDRIADIGARVWDALGVLASEAGVDKQAVWRELVAADRDRVEIHGQGSGLRAEAAPRLLDGVRILAASAACTSGTQGPRPWYPSATAEAGARYEDAVWVDGPVAVPCRRIGVAVLGSRPPQFSLLPDCNEVGGEDDARHRHKVLWAMLRAVRGALDNGSEDPLRSFATGVEKGVSGNACQVLLDLTARVDSITLTVEWGWARAPGPATAPVTFRKQDRPLLEKAVQHLRDLYSGRTEDAA